MTIPSLAGCVFAAWVTSAPAFNNVNVIRVQSSPPCEMQAQVIDGILVLQREEGRVEIPLSPGQGWYRLVYDWAWNMASVLLPATVMRGQPVKRE